MYCGDDDFYNSYYHAAELWKFEPESEEQKEARKKMKEMMEKEREINHESEDEEAYWKGYNEGYAQSTKDWLEAKNKRRKKFVPPPTPEEFKSFSHIPLKNIEGT